MGVMDLVLIGELARHVDGCERCWRVSTADGSAAAGVVGDTPVEWLRWAVWQVPALRDVAVAVGLDRRRTAPWASVIARPTALPVPDDAPTVSQERAAAVARAATERAAAADIEAAAAEAARVRRIAAGIRRDGVKRRAPAPAPAGGAAG